MRTLLFELHPASLAEKGFSHALADLITSAGREEGPQITFTSTRMVEPKPETTVAMFRIAQEALANARKHAHAASIRVTLAETDGQIVLTVADDGVGFDLGAPRPVTADTRSGGMGLRSMRERAEAAGLTLTVHSALGAGTAILVVAPIGGDDTTTMVPPPN
jgi:signal transduction histidine kinase